MGHLHPFHLAIPVRSLSETRKFYGELLGCVEGRSTEEWIDWNFFGHQITAHVNAQESRKVAGGMVDGKEVPCRHFGIILPMNEWEDLRRRLETQTLYPTINFLIKPYVRFKGEVGEQATMFFFDPSDNALEFKAFRDPKRIFMK